MEMKTYSVTFQAQKIYKLVETKLAVLQKRKITLTDNFIVSILFENFIMKLYLISSIFKIIVYGENTFPATRIAFQSNFISSTAFTSKYGPRSLANLVLLRTKARLE